MKRSEETVSEAFANKHHRSKDNNLTAMKSQRRLSIYNTY